MRLLSKQQQSLQEHLDTLARQDRELARTMRPGPEKDALLGENSEADAAAHIDKWLASPELRRPD